MWPAEVTVRVDAGPGIGLGHVRRCMTLAAVLHDAGCPVRIVANERWEAHPEPVVPYPITYLNVDARSGDGELQDADATLRQIGSEPACTSWVIVDHYQLGERWEKRVNEAGHRVAAIDDFRNRRHHAELLVSDSEQAFDPHLNGQRSAVALAGRAYALIGHEYAYSEHRPAEATRPLRVLVSYGAADVTGETLKALAAIRSLKTERFSRELIGEVHVVVGPFNRAGEEIQRAARDVEGAVVHHAPRSLAPFIRSANLFLTAGGNSLVEALALRKPCLVTITAANQELMVAQLANEAVIRSLGWHEPVSMASVARTLVEVAQHVEVFAAQVISKPVFDHLGAQRVVEVMERLSNDSAMPAKKRGHSQVRK